MKRGEIRWVSFPKPDKRRPVLLLTRDSVRDSVRDYLMEVTVAPVTRTFRDSPSEVLLSREDGMPAESVVNCDHLQTIPQARLGPRITTLSSLRMQEVSDAITFALALNE
jgi:mRNA interferase MazF